jgi:hypothetical protein
MIQKYICGDQTSPKLYYEHMQIVSTDLASALREVVSAHPEDICGSPAVGDSMHAPYLFIYHRRYITAGLSVKALISEKAN